MNKIRIPKLVIVKNEIEKENIPSEDLRPSSGPIKTLQCHTCGSSTFIPLEYFEKDGKTTSMITLFCAECGRVVRAINQYTFEKEEK